jgi:tetratricopeptide (TPR) repeat protein
MVHRKSLLILCTALMLTGYPAPAQLLPSPILVKSKILFADRNFPEAKNLLTRIARGTPEYPEAQYYLGRIAVEQKDYDESIQRFEKAVNSRPDVVEYHNWLGVMYGVVAMDANPIKQAYLAPKIKNEFEKAAALDPNNLQTQWGLITYFTSAPGFLGGSWEKSFECARVIARNNPAQGLRALGLIYSAQKKMDLAEKEFVAALKLEPTNPENDYALARFYEDHGKYEEAFAVYDVVLKKDPGNMVAAFRVGSMSARRGCQLEKGILYLNQYLAYSPRLNEPSHSGANISLGMIYEKKGDKPKAKSYYETSLKLEPGMKEALAGLARLN